MAFGQGFYAEVNKMSKQQIIISRHIDDFVAKSIAGKVALKLHAYLTFSGPSALKEVNPYWKNSIWRKKFIQFYGK